MGPPAVVVVDIGPERPVELEVAADELAAVVADAKPVGATA